MYMVNNDNIGFIVVKHDIDNNSILVRPYSLSFKNPINTYDCYNIAINNLDSTLTILIVTHRISTLENCNRIVELENGCVKNISLFHDLSY